MAMRGPLAPWEAGIAGQHRCSRPLHRQGPQRTDHPAATRGTNSPQNLAPRTRRHPSRPPIPRPERRTPQPRRHPQTRPPPHRHRHTRLPVASRQGRNTPHAAPQLRHEPAPARRRRGHHRPVVGPRRRPHHLQRLPPRRPRPQRESHRQDRTTSNPPRSIPATRRPSGLPRSPVRDASTENMRRNQHRR